MTEETVPARTEDGRFPKGVSGNPAGRPKGKKHEITELRLQMEKAVLDHLPIARVQKIVERMASMAEGGSVAAAKLLLDKIIPNARDDSDDGENLTPRIVVRIENATFAAKNAPALPSELPAVEATFTEVKQNEQAVSGSG